jgi:hypothetical protein
MSLREVKQAYVVHTQVLGLDSRPFPKKNILNRSWHPYFCESRCFTKNRELIYGQHPGKPFIPYLGSVWFDPITNVNITSNTVSYHYQDLLYNGNQTVDGQWDSVFGYSPEIRDQRMYHLCWSLCKPIGITAKTNNKIGATGKIFIRIYPSGYIAVIFAIDLDWSQCKESLDIVEIIQESKPWICENQWNWNSRIHNGKLNEILIFCEKNLRKSFLIKNNPAEMLFNVNNNNWYSLVRIFNNRNDKREIATRFDLENYKFKSFNFLNRNQANINLILSSENLFFIFYDEKTYRKIAQADLWRFYGLLEFVIYKTQIYRDVNQSLKKEIEQLKIRRINYLKTPITWENIVDYTIYDSELIDFLTILDDYTIKHNNIDSFYQKNIYPLLSQSVNLESEKSFYVSVLKSYEEEAKLWEPLVTKIYKSLIAPITFIINSSKGGST